MAALYEAFLNFTGTINITEPVLYQIRRRLPVSFGGIDLSPVIVLLIIMFLQNFVVRSLLHFSRTFIH